MPARTLALAASILLLLPCALAAQDSRDELRRDLDRLARGEHITGLPSPDSVAPGALNIPRGATVGRTVVARGPVDVAGRVNGSVVSLSGDVVLHDGAIVTGDVLSVGGRVIADSGEVQGEIRTASALPALSVAATRPVVALSPAQRTFEAVKLLVGTFGVLLIVALGVLLFAGRNLDEVVATIESRFSQAFLAGILGQVLLLPGLVLLIVALAVSLIGILLIPFAIVAYTIAAAGLVTLGFLAVARLIGGSVWQGGEASERARALRGLAVGVALFFVLWMLAALLGWAPLAATVVRAAALAATWAAMTLGLGAALLSRAGTHRRVAAASRPVELASWQTPTPIGGVVAARRPVVTSREA